MAKKSTGARLRLWVLVGVFALLGLILLGRLFTSPLSSAARALAGSDREKRLVAVNSLLVDGSPRAIEVLTEYARDPDDQVAAHVLDALGRRRARVDVIKQALADTRPALRQAAANGLAQMGRKHAEGEALIALLEKDTDPQVRAAAAKALGTLLVWDAMPRLIKALRDPSLPPRRNAYAAVVRITGVNYGRYNAEAPAEEREAFVRFMEENWKSFETGYRNYLQMLDARGQ